MLFCPDYVMKSSQGSEVMSVPAQEELESSSHTINTFGNYKINFFCCFYRLQFFQSFLHDGF